MKVKRRLAAAASRKTKESQASQPTQSTSAAAAPSAARAAEAAKREADQRDGVGLQEEEEEEEEAAAAAAAAAATAAIDYFEEDMPAEEQGFQQPQPRVTSLRDLMQQVGSQLDAGLCGAPHCLQAADIYVARLNADWSNIGAPLVLRVTKHAISDAYRATHACSARLQCVLLGSPWRRPLHGLRRPRLEDSKGPPLTSRRRRRTTAANTKMKALMVRTATWVMARQMELLAMVLIFTESVGQISSRWRQQEKTDRKVAPSLAARKRHNDTPTRL